MTTAQKQPAGDFGSTAGLGLGGQFQATRIMMTFDDWVKQNSDEYGLDVSLPNDLAIHFARRVWNGAITSASDLVRACFDECEPWITPEEVDALKA